MKEERTRKAKRGRNRLKVRKKGTEGRERKSLKEIQIDRKRLAETNRKIERALLRPKER